MSTALQPAALLRVARLARLVASAVVVALAAPAWAGTSILFIGNSFTYGAVTPAVQNYKVNTVVDLNWASGSVPNGVGTQIGGVPALFKQMTVDAGLNYDVSLATFPGSNLDTHYNDAARRALIDKPWDKVAMHGQSNLDFAAPNNPSKISQYTGLLGAMFQAKNAAVDVSLTATWSRADLTIASGTNTCATNPASSPWCGAAITQMGIDVQAGYDVAKAANPTIVSRVNPVGLAWNAALNAGFADTNPYNGIDAGKVNLWASDSYHASAFGYYLHALTVFGQVTGLSPTVLGFDTAASDLGFTPQQAALMQGFAAQAIASVPEPSQWLMLALGGGVLVGLARRRRSITVA
jgi:PEP-CTERM motif